MIPNKGTTVPLRRRGGRQECAANLATALRSEFKTGSHAAKTIMRWTGVSNRGARYWLAGERCPNGWQLILLARHSDAVLRALLGMCGRPALELHLEIDTLRNALSQALKSLAVIEPEGRLQPADSGDTLGKWPVIEQTAIVRDNQGALT